MVPTTAVIATLKPLKMLGNALGSRTLRKAASGAAHGADEQQAFGRIALSSVSVSMTIGKNEMRKVMSTFGR